MSLKIAFDIVGKFSSDPHKLDVILAWLAANKVQAQVVSVVETLPLPCVVRSEGIGYRFTTSEGRLKAEPVKIIDDSDGAKLPDLWIDISAQTETPCREAGGE